MTITTRKSNCMEVQQPRNKRNLYPDRKEGQRWAAKVAAGGLEWVKWWLVDGAVPHLLVNKLGGTTGKRDRLHNPWFQHWEIQSKPLTVKTCGGCGGGRNSQPHGRFFWRDLEGPRIYRKPPTQGIRTRSVQFACEYWWR